MKTALCLLLLGLFVGSAFGAVSATTSSISSTNFNSTPVKIFDYANTTTGTPDASITANTIWTSGVVFGAGATNATIYVWALKYNPISAGTSPGVLTSVIKRTLNASQVVVATDTTESPVIAADSPIGITTTNPLKQDPLLATCPGYFALAANAPGTTQPGSTDMLMLWYAAGTGSSATAVTVDTSSAVVAGTSPAGLYYTFAVSALWAEDNVFYVLYEAQKQTGGSAAGSAFASPTGSTTTLINLQGVNVTSGKLQFTAAISVAGTVAFTTTTAAKYNQPLAGAIGAGTNSSMSPTIQLLWKDTTALKVMYNTVTKSTGVAGSAAAVTAADVAAYAAGPPVVNAVTSLPGGFIMSNYTYGIVISNTTQNGASSYLNGADANFNGTSTLGGAFQLSTNTAQTNTITVKSFPYGTGFAVVSITQPTTAATGASYSLQAYLANGTTNGTAIAIGTSPSPVSMFVDVAGAAWIGYYNYDTNAVQGPTTGYVGRVISQTNYYNATSTKAANVLATFAAILSFVIASLFMF